VIEELVDDQGQGNTEFGAFEGIESEIFSIAPDANASEFLLLDDAVTGVGNEDLWEEPECEEEGSGEGASCASPRLLENGEPRGFK